MPSRSLREFLASLTFAKHHTGRYITSMYYRHALGEVEEPIELDGGVEIRTPEQVAVGARTRIKRGCILNGRSTCREHGIRLRRDVYIKEYCYLDSYDGFIDIAGPCAIAQFTMIHGGGGVSIGRHVMIGGHCYIIASNHNTTSLELPYMLQGDHQKGVFIDDNVWIGGGCIILDGVHIGRNCVIGAGSVVTKDIPPNTRFLNAITPRVDQMRWPL